MPSVIYMETSGAEKKESSSDACGFLEQKKIIYVDATKQTKKRTQQSVVGHLSSVKNTDIFTAQTAPKVAKKEKQPNLTPMTSKAGPSCIHIDMSPEDSQSEQSEYSDSELCCVCKKYMPEKINLAFVLEFANWGQCDRCQHWTNLKYCSSVRCLRRGDNFLCPHCDPNTCVSA